MEDGLKKQELVDSIKKSLEKECSGFMGDPVPERMSLLLKELVVQSLESLIEEIKNENVSVEITDGSFLIKTN